MSSKVGEVRERYKSVKEAKIIGNPKFEASEIQVAGTCRGVVCTQSLKDNAIYSYGGILQRPNGELLEFSEIGERLESIIAKASSETGILVVMQGFFNNSYLVVKGLRLDDIKSKRYEE
ncbi:MAG: hypothetical protein PHO02_01200 [Candidatus Nanoarchaeia archaeon]|nr:hypothetical protein [Candidatus Nanoarchaeia archaeon]